MAIAIGVLLVIGILALVLVVGISRAPRSGGLSPDGRPEWMNEGAWSSRVATYRQQGRSEHEIRSIAQHLAQRGPDPSKAQMTARATAAGVVNRAEYMDPETEKAALAVHAGGSPDAWVERVRDRLLVVTPSGWVNPRSRTAWRAGIYQFNLRGVGYHEAAAKAGGFTPGSMVELVREPDNPHDSKAVAVYADGAERLAGYVPKGMAKRIAKLLDDGADLVSYSTRGDGPGKGDTTPAIIACERALWEHLNRRR